MKYSRKLIVVIIFVVSVFVSACSGPTTKTVIILPTATSIPPTVTSVVSTPTPELQPQIEIPEHEDDIKNMHLTFWHPWAGHAANAIDDLVNEFNKTNQWKIKVLATPSGNDDYLSTRALSSFQQHQAPDLIAAPITFLRLLYEQKNALADLNPFVQHAKWGISKDEELTYSLIFWQQDMDGSFRFGMPAQRDAQVLFYNQTWAKELGFDEPPATPHDFLNQSCAAARSNAFDDNPDNNGTGGWIYSTQPLTVLSWLRAFNGGELPQKDNAHYVLENQANAEAFTFLNKIYSLGCAWIGKDPHPYRYFANRNALFYSGSLQSIRVQEKLEAKDSWIVISYPSVKGEDVILTDGYSYGVFKSTPEKNLAAWLFIRWMQKPENQARLIEATATFQLTNTALEKLKEFRKAHYAWDAAIQYLPLARPAPSLSSWALVGRVLQDAAWQLTQITVKSGDIYGVLEQAEKLIREILSK